MSGLSEHSNKDILRAKATEEQLLEGGDIDVAALTISHQQIQVCDG